MVALTEDYSYITALYNFLLITQYIGAYIITRAENEAIKCKSCKLL